MVQSIRVALLGVCLAWAYAQDYDFDEDLASGFDEYGGMDFGQFGGDGFDPYGDFNPYAQYGEYGGGPTNSAKELFTIDEVQEFIAGAQSDAVVMGYFDAVTNTNDLEIFTEMAFDVTVPVAFTTAPDILEESRYDGCAVVVYKPTKYTNSKYEKVKARYPGKTLRADSLLTFVNSKVLPLVGVRTYTVDPRYEASGLPVVTLYTQTNLELNEKVYTYYANRMRKVAQGFQGKVLFAIGSLEDYAYKMESFGMDVGADDVVLEDRKMSYKMDKPFGVDNLQEFVDAYLAKTLTGGVEKPKYQREIDGEPEQLSFDGSDVVTLTNDNFDEVVLDSERDVMVEFYAPWCGHCQSLKPEYMEAAQRLRSVDTVTLAAMDATAHDVPDGFDVQGYPSLYFVRANDKGNPIPYQGSRDSLSIVDFVQRHSSFSRSRNEL